MDKCWTCNLVLERASEESIVADGVGNDCDEVGVSDGVRVVGEDEILAYYCSGVDISGDIDVDGVEYCPLDLRLRVAMYDGAGIVVICSGCGVTCWLGCWSGVYEV